MAKTSCITENVTIQGDGVSFNWSLCGPFVNPNAPEGGTVSQVLAPGSNAIAVPAGAVWLAVISPVASTNAKILKGASGDTGFAFGVSPAPPPVVPVGGVATVYITSTVAETIALLWG
jgi:hypothetical protein